MALHGAVPKKHGSHQPSKKSTGKKIREGFDVVQRLAGKGKKKRASKRQDTSEGRATKRANVPTSTPPKPRINPSLHKHRRSIKSRELRPSVAGLQRAQ